ncbi:MAG: hypothetical protein H6685_09330 [Deltaproteobacteria bacterium]|nr:hypothetical protein [Deltaproteobacteria bacterium]
MTTHDVDRPRPARTRLLTVFAVVWVVAIFWAFTELGQISAVKRHQHAGSNEGDYLTGAVNMHLRLRAGEPAPATLIDPGYIMAPMQLALAQPTLSRPDVTLEKVRRLSLIHFFLALAMTTLLAARLFGPVGVILAPLFLASIHSSQLVVFFYNQLALTAFALTLTIYCLIRTEFLTSRLWIVATGIAMGFALLCHRGSPLLMLLPPLGIYALLTWRQLKFLVALRGTLFILIIAVAIAHGHLYDYYVVSEHVVAKPGSETGAYVFQELKHGLLSGDGLFFHYISLITIHFPHFVGWLWIPCAAFLARRGKYDGRFWLIVATAVLPPLWFGFFGTKNNDYIYPVMPFFALIFAGGIDQIPRRGPRLAVATGVVLVTIVTGWIVPAFTALGPDRIPERIWQQAVFWSRAMPFDRSSLGMTLSCDEFVDLMKTRGEKPGGIVIAYGPPEVDEFALDMMPCVQMRLADWAVSRSPLPDDVDEANYAEIWVYPAGAKNADTAVEMGRVMAKQEPGIPFESYMGLDPAPRPDGNAITLPSTIQDKPVAVYGLVPPQATPADEAPRP